MDFVCFFHENEKLVLENRIQTKANRELRQWNLIMMSPKRKKRKKKKKKLFAEVPASFYACLENGVKNNLHRNKTIVDKVKESPLPTMKYETCLKSAVKKNNFTCFISFIYIHNLKPNTFCSIAYLKSPYFCILPKCLDIFLQISQNHRKFDFREKDSQWNFSNVESRLGGKRYI